MPPDYIRAEIINFDNKLLLSDPDKLDFTEPVNRDTPEITPQKRTAKYKGLVFQYHPEKDRMFLSGSLHIFWNDGDHNYNDYTLTGFIETLRRLYDLFGIRPENIHLTQLEWGLNIVPTIPSNEIIEHCLFHRWKPFEHRIDSTEGKYYQVEHPQYYILKLYNKGLHYKLNREILRFERKQLKWSKYCKQIGIGQTLHDLIESDFKGCRETLMTNWNEILFFDPCIVDDGQKEMKYREKIYWKKFIKEKDNPNKNVISKTSRKKHVDRLREYNVKHGQNIQGKISDLLDQKITELNNDVFTFSPSTYTGKTLTSEIRPEVKYCQLTGLEITMQRSDSFLLSHTGLRHYQKNNIDTFNEIRNEYLTDNWKDSDLDTQIKKIAHNIRGRHTYKKKREQMRNLRNSGQLNLFKQMDNRIIFTHYGLTG